MRGRELFLDRAHLGAGFGAAMDARGLDRDLAGRLIGNYERVRDGELVLG